MKKLPRLADVKFTDASGKPRKRYTVRKMRMDDLPGWYVWDAMQETLDSCFVSNHLRIHWIVFHPEGAKKYLQKYLKNTTVRRHQLKLAERALDRGAGMTGAGR